MTEMILHRSKAGFTALASAFLPVLALLAGCGGGNGGVIPDNAGTSATNVMQCTDTCIESDTLAPGKMEAHFYLVDDGSRLQAQAGFFSGFSIGYNVELQGDVLNYLQGTSTTRMALANQDPNAFFSTLGLPGSPYLADVPSLPTAAVTGQFQLVRAAQTLTSEVTLPAPFRITTPSNNATVSKATGSVAIQLDSAQPGAAWQVSAICTDTGGTDYGQAGGAGSSLFTTADGREVSFDLASYEASLQFTQQNGTPAVITHCIVTFQATVTNDGTVADGFQSGSAASGIQLRTVSIDVK
jgi:hypothetical protein